jgi:antitoxin VapB
MYILNIRRRCMHTVKVFISGNSQAVRLPKEYSTKEKELLIQKVGNSIILRPVKNPWKTLRESLSLFTEDAFSDGREQPDMQDREGL